MPNRFARAFTLVEILIVVVILGILAAIVVPQFSSTVNETSVAATQSELRKLRRHIGVYQARNEGSLPDVLEGDGTWGQLVASGGEYLLGSPVNAWVGGENSRTIVFGNAADLAHHTDYGWIYDPATGEIWAGAFDEDDQPFARP